MDIYSLIIIIGLAGSVLLGCLMGFGRVLKLLTGGIVGIICSALFCVMFGGIIANIPFVAELIAKGNEYLGQYAEFLAKISVATWIYYVALFILAQIVRIILVKCVAKAFTPKDKKSKLYGVRNIINRGLGVIVMGGSFVLLVYLVLACVALFSDVEAVSNFITTLSEAEKPSIFYLMYKSNPIDLYAMLNL